MRSLAALALAFVVSIAQVSAFLPPSLPAPAGGLPRSETRRSIQTPGAVCSLPKPHSTPVFGRRGEKTSLRIFDKLFGGGKDKEPVAPRGGGKAPPCTCRGTGAIGCPTCAGTGIDKKGGPAQAHTTDCSSRSHLLRNV
ncbi:hypothetical protein T484DRAFT_1746650 [Baffinella frigidus]|nr:hypothetical protein T484DRAFT_1746650 [Cryptophyta sp. CCMP2293]